MVSVPSSELATGVAALGAVTAPIDCSMCDHSRRAVGDRVAYVRAGRAADGVVAQLVGETVSVGGIRFTRRTDFIHRLPSDFPDRADRQFQDVVRGLGGSVYGAQPLRGHLAASAHPVVVLGNSASQFQTDVDVLSHALPERLVGVRLDAAQDLDEWFRHPVLLAGPEAHLRNSWCAALRPRIVILTGRAAVRADVEAVWPGTPVLALLSRRRPSSAVAASELVVDRIDPDLVAGVDDPGAFLSADGLQLGSLHGGLSPNVDSCDEW